MGFDHGPVCKKGESANRTCMSPRLGLTGFSCIRRCHLRRRVNRDALSCQVVRRLWRCCHCDGRFSFQDNLLRLDIVTRSEWRDPAHLESRRSRKYRERRRKPVHAWPRGPSRSLLFLGRGQILAMLHLRLLSRSKSSFSGRGHPTCIWPWHLSLSSCVAR
jgi:hypothetical protein